MEEEFDKSFEEVYEKVCNESIEKLKDAKKQQNKFLIAIFVISLIVNAIIYLMPNLRYLIGLTISLCVCFFIVFLIVGNNTYRKVYKDYVIQGLVNRL